MLNVSTSVPYKFLPSEKEPKNVQNMLTSLQICHSLSIVKSPVNLITHKLVQFINVTHTARLESSMMLCRIFGTPQHLFVICATPIKVHQFGRYILLPKLLLFLYSATKPLKQGLHSHGLRITGSFQRPHSILRC